MLKNTFVHIKGIGFKLERSLWRKGILTWDDLMENHKEVELSDSTKKRAARIIGESKNSLSSLDARYFLKTLPKSETWRIYPEFKQSTAFVDVETDNTRGPDSITMIGIYSSSAHKAFVKAKNLPDAGRELSRHALWITFNGTYFDLPLIYALFPDLKGTHLHLDVMHSLHSVGIKGGLKKIEKKLDIKRSEKTRNLTGWDAVRLWDDYRNGSLNALKVLERYNGEDCKNLEPLAELAYSKLRHRTFRKYEKITG